MGWLSGWKYQKQLYINSTNIVTQSNYQMKITINYSGTSDSSGNISCGGNCNTDFSDIRFTGADGSTPLYYWIESYTQSSTAIVWVKIPSIPNGPNSAYIYFYYGNPNSGATTSDGTSTFIFFDDFNGTSLDTNKWIADSSVTYSVSNSKLTVTSSTPNWGVLVGIYTKNSFPVQNSFIADIINLTWSQSSAADMDMFYALFTNGTSTVKPFCIGVYDECSGQNAHRTAQIENNSTYAYTCGSYPNALALTGTAQLQIVKDQNNSTQVFWDGTSLLGPYVSTTTISKFYFLINRYSNSYPFSTFTVDRIRVRNYAPPEPTWSSTIYTLQSPIFDVSSNPIGAEIYLASPTTNPYVDQVKQTTTTTTPGTKIYTANGTNTYDLKLTKGGYQDWTLQSICGAQPNGPNCITGQTYNIVATLNLLPGSLYISSTPSGAEVWLSGYDYNVQTNTTITGLNPSPPDYNITLKLSGYRDWTGSATVYTQLTTEVIATFAGSAYISSTPSGASVYLDGSPTPSGNTPLTITNLTPATSDGSVPTQSHTYILRLAGYADTSGSFTATAGQTANVSITFPGSLNIISIPVGAQIYIDGIQQ